MYSTQIYTAMIVNLTESKKLLRFTSQLLPDIIFQLANKVKISTFINCCCTHFGNLEIQSKKKIQFVLDLCDMAEKCT